MPEDRASITALVNAYVRAYHAQENGPKIFDDFVARDLFTDHEFHEMGEKLASSLAFFDPQRAASCPDQATALAAVIHRHNAPILLSRARYAEDELERHFAHGVRQYVILGAGLDTFAYRRRGHLDAISVFELDQAATQTTKCSRLAERGLRTVHNVHYVPVDFTKESVADVLRRSSFNPSAPAFVSCLGVTYYLERGAVLGMLRSLATILRKGSTIVFDYFDPGVFDPEKSSQRIRRMLEIVARVGEPMITAFEPAALHAELASVGWRLVESLDPALIEDRYFRGRGDSYHAFENVHFARAELR